FHTFKDQVIFEKLEVAKDDDSPYTIYTPYSKKWKSLISNADIAERASLKKLNSLLRWKGRSIPSLKSIGFEKSDGAWSTLEIDRKKLRAYAQERNFPGLNSTTRLGLHLRFGTLSVREAVRVARKESEAWLNELIWREFFMQILWNFPHVVKSAFRPAYDAIPFRHDKKEFRLWCEGRTGYPIVDAGMRELNATGFMHNRVRMITASFLVKHLLIDWRWGEAYFAKKLLDFELASNNGNWQWVAGTGCDAAPYFRVFNPDMQAEKFDPDQDYIRKWIPEFATSKYPEPMIDHKTARVRALRAYSKALNRSSPQRG
ncbi:MAG TPA: deoxyribodipyrimidine photo-lyase, partial [Bdellovibrionales bacterium]|nr:deoxyribodipyrimidine photo-lyase [Bdellovibrionales bacterium]